jgi:nicotinate-nucleotide pyrophosphorylase (carboxylating)
MTEPLARDRAATLTPQRDTPDASDIARVVDECLAEDIGNGDLTARLIDAATTCRARLIVRESAILCGTAWFDRVYERLDAGVTVHWEAADGDRIVPGQLICTIDGPARSVNSGERTALNLLQTLSGTATVARRHADAVAATATVILDTRKTLPGLRSAQKYAVRRGGCANHRMGLHDAMLIKENHIAAAGGLQNAVARARAANPGAPLELEVETLAQLDQALALGVTMIMLDNFSLDAIRDAVRRSRGKARLEVSGGVSLEELGTLAATGVDFISVGALTKHLHAVDFSMRVDEA